VSKEERLYRKQLHRLCLVLMMIHGAIRNRWCNDYQLGQALRGVVSPQALALLRQPENNDLLNSVKSRRFLDGLQKVLRAYSAKFRVSGEGIKRKNWNELSLKQPRRFKNVDFDRFKYLISHFRGSRDLAAQGFVCLLRAIGLNARLVFSLQPPDFTIIATLPKIEALVPEKKPETELVSNNFGTNNKSKLLSSIRSKSATVTEQPVEPLLEDAPFPVFWAEVWDQYSKKWVSIDPAVLQILEIAPMRNKSKFEPPQSEPRNQLYYSIAYNSFGVVKDVTRRYTHYFNAKTAKKRITYKSEEETYWYERVLSSMNTSIQSKPTNLDIMELKEFYDRDLGEGMPNNISDFNNHPIYALESQLKQNEVIYPMDSTSKCGTFRAKTSSRSKKGSFGVIPVYKRAHVHMLRSAKAWYMRGRVLKVGVQPLKLKKKSALQKKNDGSDTEDEEEHTNLYAEFQTRLFIPQPIVDGVIPKNAYGNIDLYTSTMMPEGGCLIDTTGKYTMKMAEYAARSILEIDYAKAIIAFDFGKNGKSKPSAGRTPTAREGGIVIHDQYEEAMLAVLDSLVEEEEQNLRDKVKMNSLKYWKFFLTKLRISERLN
ncbi:Rad4-domain-containing protein, partial [Suhomyces tanzawaensis NRRL Y-17324]